LCHELALDSPGGASRRTVDRACAPAPLRPKLGAQWLTIAFGLPVDRENFAGWALRLAVLAHHPRCDLPINDLISLIFSLWHGACNQLGGPRLGRAVGPADEGLAWEGGGPVTWGELDRWRTPVSSGCHGRSRSSASSTSSPTTSPTSTPTASRP